MAGEETKDPMASHPWGASHSESHEVTDIVAKLEKQIETIPEEKAAAAVEAIRKATAERNALPGQILKGVLGLVIDAAK